MILTYLWTILRRYANGIEVKTPQNVRFFLTAALVHAVIYKLATGVRINVRAMGKYRRATQRATNVARGGEEIPLKSFPSFCQRNARILLFFSSLLSPQTIYSPYLSCFCSPVFHAARRENLRSRFWQMKGQNQAPQLGIIDLMLSDTIFSHWFVFFCCHIFFTHFRQVS